MGKVKNYIMDIEEKVFDIDGLETKIGECEHIAEMKAFVVEKLGLKTHFDIGIAEVWQTICGTISGVISKIILDFVLKTVYNVNIIER